MNVIFISPEITMSKLESANRFKDECIKQLMYYNSKVMEISDIGMYASFEEDVNKKDIVVVFNDNEPYSREALELIEGLKEKEVEFWPVAVDKEYRIPTEPISSKQSFDLYEQLRVRNIKEDYIETIAKVFARNLLAKIKPTLYRKECLLFLSHRRVDGEEITAVLFDTIKKQFEERAFRDVVDVKIGEEAQEKIYDALAESDILIFLHTKKAAESEWIQRELVHAILYDIPILWVKIDEADDSNLYIKPGDKPHIECSSSVFENETKTVKLADEILDKSFKMIMTRSNKILSSVKKIREFCSEHKYSFEGVLNEELIYRLRADRKGYPYPQRPMEKYIQFFGRKYVDEDVEKFQGFLENEISGTIRSFDSGLILSNNIKLMKERDHIVEENCDDFYHILKKHFGKSAQIKDTEIVISGSFPNCDELYKNSLMDAVIVFSKEILKNNCKLVFGAHPTFQDIILKINTYVNPNRFKETTKMYISKFFVTEGLEKFEEQAEVVQCEAVKGEDGKKLREKSLSDMRRRMIAREEVKALICLGGKKKSECESPGIDEEIKIAQENNIPVFLIGSVGGRSAELAAEYKKNGKWNELNNEGLEFNEELMLDLDYGKLVNDIIRKITPEEGNEDK
ncbi:SLOG domain-containing protein [Oceanirhabdus sp. W0125-5]|uniref:SLOG domain-containing protein n=1 Tax=Oceanirhabdus sp. W0125-5 TaxID=2999116 RepID=UPI0022F33C43|nr:TIR domain-containing protein [Oceanirhabdus sp. W0125-5]WBW98852.1 TIR domain-containing protein [Oceanirhabdus sp. W0125-5]